MYSSSSIISIGWHILAFLFISGINFTECTCEKACEGISFDIESSMATMRGVSLKKRMNDLPGKVQYAHEIHHRTDMSIFTKTIRAFTSVTDVLELLTKSISRTRKPHHEAIFRSISRAAGYLCEDLKNFTKTLQKMSTSYNVLYGYENKYIWDLLDKFVGEFGLFNKRLFQMPEGIEPGQDRQMHSLIKNMKKTFTPLLDIISTFENRETSTQYYAIIAGTFNESYKFFPGRRKNIASFVKLELLLSSLNESLDTSYVLANPTKWFNDTTGVWLGTLKLYKDLREREKEFASLHNEMDEFSQLIDNQTCNEALDLTQLSDMDFYFELAKVLISGEKAFYLNVSQSYYNSTLPKQKVFEIISEKKIKSTIDQVEFVEEMFIGNVTTLLVNLIDEFEKELLELYSSSLSLMDQLQDYYENTDMFNSLARNLQIFYNPQIDVDSFHYENKSLWLPTHSIKDLRQVGRSLRKTV